MYWRYAQNGFVHVCGHRGHSVGAPENTLAALRVNRDMGGTTAEIDTVLTADGEIVVIHDLSVDRTTDGTGIVADMTLAQVRALDAGSWFDSAFAGERIATLSEVLTLSHEIGLGLEIEVKEKRNLPKYTDRLVQVLADTESLSHVMAISFDHVYLRHLKARLPGLATGGIVHARHGDPVGVAQSAGLDELCIDLAVFHPDDARALHDAGIAIRCHAYNPGALALMAAAGLDARPQVQQWLREGLIDTLSSDDVAWAARTVAEAL